MIYIYRPKDILYLKHESEWIYVARKWGLHSGNERAWAMYLNKDDILLEFVMSNRSDNNEYTMVDIEGIVERGYSIGATQLIFFHCHEKNPVPSQQDIKLTWALKKKAEEFDMKLLESVIEGQTYRPFCIMKNDYANMLDNIRVYGYSLDEKFSFYKNGVPEKEIIAGLDFSQGRISPFKWYTEKAYHGQGLIGSVEHIIYENIILPFYLNYGLIKNDRNKWIKREKDTKEIIKINAGKESKIVPSIVDIIIEPPQTEQHEYE